MFERAEKKICVLIDFDIGYCIVAFLDALKSGRRMVGLECAANRMGTYLW